MILLYVLCSLFAIVTCQAPESEGNSADAEPKTEIETSINSLNHDEMANIASRLDNPDDIRRLRESSFQVKASVGMEPIYRIAGRLSLSPKQTNLYGIPLPPSDGKNKKFVNDMLAGEIDLLKNFYYPHGSHRIDTLLSSDDYPTIDFLGNHLHMIKHVDVHPFHADRNTDHTLKLVRFLDALLKSRRIEKSPIVIENLELNIYEAEVENNEPLKQLCALFPKFDVKRIRVHINYSGPVDDMKSILFALSSDCKKVFKNIFLDIVFLPKTEPPSGHNEQLAQWTSTLDHLTELEIKHNDLESNLVELILTQNNVLNIESLKKLKLSTPTVGDNFVQSPELFPSIVSKLDEIEVNARADHIIYLLIHLINFRGAELNDKVIKINGSVSSINTKQFIHLLVLLGLRQRLLKAGYWQKTLYDSPSKAPFLHVGKDHIQIHPEVASAPAFAYMRHHLLEGNYQPFNSLQRISIGTVHGQIPIQLKFLAAYNNIWQKPFNKLTLQLVNREMFMAADDQLVASNMTQLAKNVEHLEFTAPLISIQDIFSKILKPILMQVDEEELSVTEIVVQPKADVGNLKYCEKELMKSKIPITVSGKGNIIEIKVSRTAKE